MKHQFEASEATLTGRKKAETEEMVDGLWKKDGKGRVEKKEEEKREVEEERQRGKLWIWKEEKRRNKRRNGRSVRRRWEVGLITEEEMIEEELERRGRREGSGGKGNKRTN